MPMYFSCAKGLDLLTPLSIPNHFSTEPSYNAKQNECTIMNRAPRMNFSYFETRGLRGPISGGFLKELEGILDIFHFNVIYVRLL